MSVLHMNVPPRYALAAVALALGVSVVGGRESRPEPPPAAPSARAAPPEPALPLERLERPRLGELQANLFAAPPAPPPRAAARPAPAPSAPSAPPPLPFRYLGRYAEGDKRALYLARGDEPLRAEPGAQLGPEYRVEEVSAQAVTVVYLPLGVRQRLPIPPQP